MSEVKLPQTEAELRSLLEAAMEGGRRMGPGAEPQVSNPDLVQEYRKELDALLNPLDSEGKAIVGQRRNYRQLQALQQKHRELGVSEEDLDITIAAPEKGRTINDWQPPSV